MNKNDENMVTKNQNDNFDKGEPTKHFTNVKKVDQFLPIFFASFI